MNDRTLGRAMIGAFLVSSSARRAQFMTERTADATFRHELSQLGRTWRNRASQAGALGTGLLGAAILLAAYRRGLFETG